MINTGALIKFAPIVVGLLSGLGEVEHQKVINLPKNPLTILEKLGATFAGDQTSIRRKRHWFFWFIEERCFYRSIRKQTGLALSTIGRIFVEQNLVIEV